MFSSSVFHKVLDVSIFFTKKNKICFYKIARCRKLSTYTSEQSNQQEKNIRNESIYSEKNTIFADKILENFSRSPGNLFLDFTFGSGGHSQLILDNFRDSRVIAVDRDPAVIENYEEIKSKYPDRICFLNIKFSDVIAALSFLGVKHSSIAGAVIDCGPSLKQLYTPQRGFCPGNMWPLDLRMDGPNSSIPSALEILKTVDEQSLFKLFKYYGQHRHARKLAFALVQSRYEMINIRTPDDLINFINGISGIQEESEASDTKITEKNTTNSQEINRRIVPRSSAPVFRSLRMLINNELNELDCAVKSAHYLLRDRGSLAAVTYNSLEDTIVKRHFTGMNIDASPNTVGRQKHRALKVSGFVDHSDCIPWSNREKHILKTRWDQQFLHEHWKSAILRTARKLDTVSYDL